MFGLIPGLKNAEYMRYGVMHRNSYIDSPNRITPYYNLKDKKTLFFAGQLTGVEGYVESASSGLVAGINLANMLNNRTLVDFGRSTAIGALSHYIAEYNGSDFQPMNVNFGIMDSLDKPIRNKRERYGIIAERALGIIEDIVARGVL